MKHLQPGQNAKKSSSCYRDLRHSQSELPLMVSPRCLHHLIILNRDLLEHIWLPNVKNSLNFLIKDMLVGRRNLILREKTQNVGYLGILNLYWWPPSRAFCFGSVDIQWIEGNIRLNTLQTRSAYEDASNQKCWGGYWCPLLHDSKGSLRLFLSL